MHQRNGVMSVNTGVKGVLAKLLATEDLIIEHKQCETASFDVTRRVLTLPIWERATDAVYDLLVSHEVGHALYTPDNWNKVKCPTSILNVTEDARVEKLMKRRYAGLPKTFYKGYKELNEKDFLSVEGNLEKMNLIDRINVHFKVGNFVDVQFSDEEMEFVNDTEAAESFEDAVDVANRIFAYMKAQREQKQQTPAPAPEGTPMPMPQGGSGQGAEEFLPEEDAPIDDGMPEEITSDADEEDPTDASEGSHDDLEATTDEAFAEKIRNLATNMYDREYIEIPRIDSKNLVIPWDRFLERAIPQFTIDDDTPPHISHALNKSAEDYAEFYKKSQKEVNYLVKEFECRKAADSYARSGTSKTGVLDTSKLHTYKYNEDLFKRVTITPDGKNHGLIFILDWSGSMANCIVDTVNQVLQLAYFCRKTNIPFDVYTFGYNWGCFYNEEDREIEEVPGNLAFEHGFALTQVLTSDCKTTEFNQLALTLYRNAGAVGSLPGYWTYKYQFSCTYGMSLTGTPLIDSIAAMHSIIPAFLKKNRVQKVSLNILTDGESGPAAIYQQRKQLFGDKVYTTTFGGRCQLRDRKNGQIYPNFEYPAEQVNVFIQNLKDRFPQVNVLGFRLLNNRDARGYFRMISHMDYIGQDYVAAMDKYKKQKYMEITNSPYDKLWVLPTNLVKSDESFDELDDEATTSQIRSAFKKMYKGRQQNKKMLTSFAKTIA